MNHSAVSVVALLGLVGMALGYARDAGIAAIYGASAVSDAFFIATLIPSIFGAAIMVGAVTPALIPLLARHDHQSTDKFFNLLFTLAALVLLAVTLVVAGLAIPLVTFLAPGADSARIALAARLVVITSPALWLMGAAALLGALANARGSFGVPALTTVLVNSGMVVAVLLSARGAQIEWVGWGMVAGSALLFTLQWWHLRRHGWRYTPRFARDATTQEFLRLFLPLFVFVLLAQAVPIVERRLSAGFPDGQLSHIAYAGKLYQIPSLLVPTSFAVVLFPALVQTLHQARAGAFVETLRDGVRSILFVMLPLSLVFVFAAPALVRVIFQRGEFSPADTAATAVLLRVYSLAIVPAGLLLVLTRAFHARREMMTTLWLGILNTALYVAAAALLLAWTGLLALPLAFVLSQLFGVVSMAVVLMWRLRISFGELFDAFSARILLAALPMLGVLSAAVFWLELQVEKTEQWQVFLVWGLSVLAACVIYFGSALGLRVPDALLMRDRVLRRRVPIEREKVSV
ncbi:MAG: murein biosynthesis integral membrane protein MurJ [Chloroflexi bacterium]|nr:murein biosynthesis integral membrane protein MurJ [Chloroflexota bacterium]